jgi:2-oxo-4-hydroxy-4-carboxy-5-ureidoimidazoline decarboxylase
MSDKEIMALSDEAFVARFGFLFEHSPWVVERAARRRPFADLYAGLMQAVDEASGAERLALVRAHPELAGKAAVDQRLTVESTAEQASAGLDRLTEAEFARFHALNAAYGERFGFPFVICVRQTDKAGILAAMERRLGNAPDAELATAIEEVGEIVRLRLEDVL